MEDLPSAEWFVSVVGITEAWKLTYPISGYLYPCACALSVVKV